ncbi:MAG TPA: DUF6701 domain-containing protein, partial [Gammaproteobacteria bacterium]|nr:DUF6701 domain-containing protein [Gammaproteobacteria bacterium]
GPIQYVIDVQNEGPLEETGPVSITLTLPTGISYVSSSGTGWSCTGSGTTATCTTSGPVAVGGALPSLTINGNIAANTLSPVTATVTVSGVNFDNESNNDTATDTATWVNPTPPPPIGEPGSFNITEAGTDPHIGPIYTKIAGIGYTLNLWAFKNNGTQDNNPRNQGELYLLDATDNSGDEYGNDSGCRTTWTPIADLGPFDFTDNGSNNPLIVTLPQFPNALSSARILIVEDNGTLACSHDAFAIRPAYFAITASQDSPTTPGTTEILVAPVDASSTPYHRAGRPFTITLTPKNAAGATVTGYTTGAPAVAITGIVLPVGGTIGSYGDSGIWTFSGGTAYLETATYSEVGAFGAQATDAAFTVVDAGDGTSNCQRTIGLDCSQTTTPKYWSGPTTIGRFTPDHFDVDWNEPEFEPGCSAGFTYLQQTVGYAPAKAPELKFVAKSADGNPTVNYRSFKVAGDPFGRLTVAKIVNANSGWPDSGYSETDDSASPSDHPLDTNLVSALDNLTIQPDATDGSTGTIIFPPSTPTDNRLVIERLTAEPAAAGEPPFDATINLKLVVTDEDGVTAATNPATTTIPLGDVRYGRVLLRSAVGSELLDLPVEMIAQYYLDDDSGFVRNDEDGCSTVSGVSLANFQAYLGNTFANGNTAANFYQLNAPSRPGDLDTGNFGLSLSAPGSGHQGTVDISADVPMWLQYDWNGDGVYGDGTNADNPSSRAAFGIYKGSPHRVYQYEVIGAGS